MPASSTTSIAFGFLANEFAVRDILSLIKGALTDLTAKNFKISNNKVVLYTVYCDITVYCMLIT